MGRRVGLKDVALAAGTAPATVSHALNGTGTINGETAARVRRIAAEMGYRPNRVAANLRRQRTGVLGVLLPTLSNPFYSTLLEALGAAAGEGGYGLVFGNTNHDAAQDIRYLDLFLDQRCDGIVVVAGTPVVDHVVREGVPLVLVNTHLAGDTPVPRVEVEDMQGMRDAVAHLIRLGHRRIGMVTTRYRESRHQGYLRALADAGIAYDPALVAEMARMGNLLEDAEASVHALLRAHPELSAMVAFADIAAIGAIRAAYRLGRRVPDDLALVGFDDIPLAAMLVPALTTVAQPVGRIAASAIELILSQIGEGGAALDRRCVRLETRLVVRESCGAREGG